MKNPAQAILPDIAEQVSSVLAEVLLLAANDLRLTIRDRASFVWMLLLPLAGRQQKLVLERASDALEDLSLAAEVDLVRAIVRTLTRLAEGAKGAGAFAVLAARPPLVALAVRTAGRGRPVPQGFAQSVPGTLTMTVLMMTLIYGAVFLTLEKRQGMLRRQATLPLPKGAIFLGKLLLHYSASYIGPPFEAQTHPVR